MLCTYSYALYVENPTAFENLGDSKLTYEQARKSATWRRLFVLRIWDGYGWVFSLTFDHSW